MKKKLYLPNTDCMNANTLNKWYQNLHIELVSVNYSTEEIVYLKNYYEDAGQLSRLKKKFFNYHFGTFLGKINLYNFNGKDILDLGGGAGNFAIFFAIMGSRVTVVDLDETALGILVKRKIFYEKVLGRKLDINIKFDNVLHQTFTKKDRFDLIWSVFAFNMMQPSNELICKLLPQLRNKARFIIFDGNVDCFWLRLLKNRNREALNPNDFRMKLEENGLRKIKNFNGPSLPPLVHFILPIKLTNFMEYSLSYFFGYKFSISHIVYFQKK